MIAERWHQAEAERGGRREGRIVEAVAYIKIDWRASGGELDRFAELDRVCASPATRPSFDMSDPIQNGPPARERSAAPRVRVFMDADGTQWQVSERPFADYDRRRGLSLIFASDSVVRRVREYPAHWLQLSDEDLIALSWKS